MTQINIFTNSNRDIENKLMITEGERVNRGINYTTLSINSTLII